MNTCGNCGRENADETTHCFECGTELPQVVAVPLAPPPLIYPPIPQQAPEPAVLSERRLRIAEVCVVCAVAFSGSLFVALAAFAEYGPRYGSAAHGNYSAVHMLLHEAVALALVWWVLARRGESLSSWLLPLRASDVGYSILLWIGGSIAFTSIYTTLHALGFTPFDTRAQFHAVSRNLWGNQVALGAFAVAIFNPFFEELIVRAYLMRQVVALGGSMSLAIFISVVLQTTYHLYQGGAAAFSIGILFLISAIYYARTGRIQAVILAHFYNDFFATVFAALHHS